MSTYEKYNKTSVNYDDTRVPVGVDILLDCLSQAEKPISQLKLLDAGCGTGSYSKAIIGHVGQIEAVDASDGMLRKAAQKLNGSREKGKFFLAQAQLHFLPFSKNTFDGIMVNQVLHHIDTSTNNGFPAHRRILKEFNRVLKPGGLIVINTCSQDQLKNGYWYYRFIPEAAESFRKRYMPLERLCEMLIECGFTRCEQFVPYDEVFQGKAYFDVHGPLKESWRAGDSVFALATREQLIRAQNNIKDIDASGDLIKYIKSLDVKRENIGQGTFLLSFRNGSIT